MKKFAILLAATMLTMVTVPGHCFFDYLFGGSATTDAIGNNVVGDLRAWWTGNPVYNFNPYYSGATPTGQTNAPMQPGQNMNPTGPYQSATQYYPPQQQQPSVTYYPPQGQQYGYGPGQAQQIQPPMGAQAPMQQQYQAGPQSYQMQQPQPQSFYYQGPQQAYQGPQGYGQAPEGYQGSPGRYQTYQYEQDTPQDN